MVERPQGGRAAAGRRPGVRLSVRLGEGGREGEGGGGEGGEDGEDGEGGEGERRAGSGGAGEPGPRPAARGGGAARARRVLPAPGAATGRPASAAPGPAASPPPPARPRPRPPGSTFFFSFLFPTLLYLGGTAGPGPVPRCCDNRTARSSGADPDAAAAAASVGFVAPRGNRGHCRALGTAWRKGPRLQPKPAGEAGALAEGTDAAERAGATRGFRSSLFLSPFPSPNSIGSLCFGEWRRQVVGVTTANF